MPTIEIPVATLSIQSAKPNKRFGNPPAIPMRASNSAQRMLARAALTLVPANAVVSSAVLRVWQGAAGTGSVTLKAQANLNKGWTTSTTWSSAPGLDATEYSATRSAPAANTPWDLEVSTLVQSWVAGDATNYGWTLLTTSNTSGSLRGAAAPSRRPVLIVTYAVTPVTPTGLHPTGAADAVVSLAKPTLTFNVTADTTAIQVQVDPAANATTPAFDSGERASAAGLLNLATTTYAGLADGALTYWRARAKGALGWSEWSGWASFTRRTWRALTLDSPGTTTEDPSPPITASYVGTVTQWRTLLKSTAGATIEDSGWTAGSTVEFATTKNVTGGAGVAEAQIRDDLPRVATPGDPDFLVVRRSFTVTDGPVTPVAGVTVAQQPGRPWVVVTASRAQVPDEVLVYRDDVLVARAPGVDAFDRETMTVVDQTVSMNIRAVYSVQVMAGGRSSKKVATTPFTPRCPGIWLADETTGIDVVLWGDAEQGQEEPELAVVHEPIGGDIVRRRLARSPRRGTLEGTLADVGPTLAVDCERTLNAWAQQDAGHTYRLLLGNRNDRVILGDIVVTETAQSAQERFSEASMSWWAA